jgi:hypothetical protein
MPPGVSLTVTADPGAEALGLTDVEQLPRCIAEKIDARLRGQRLEKSFPKAIRPRPCGNK